MLCGQNANWRSVVILKHLLFCLFYFCLVFHLGVIFPFRSSCSCQPVVFSSSWNPAGLIISLQLLRGDTEQVRRENPLIFSRGVAITRKLGFPDVIMPGESDILQKTSPPQLKGVFLVFWKQDDQKIIDWCFQFCFIWLWDHLYCCSSSLRSSRSFWFLSAATASSQRHRTWWSACLPIQHERNMRRRHEYDRPCKCVRHQRVSLRCITSLSAAADKFINALQPNCSVLNHPALMSAFLQNKL